ncbi:MAG TPA: hypothetical protein VET85_03865 [Stellaceae bacterium]|nr:hypothetical protein [Stellaceae bacterium]
MAETSETPEKQDKAAAGAASGAAAAALRGRVDQVGAILAKSLDLAEAGLSLGVTIVSRVGAVAQEQILDRMVAAATAATATASAPPAPPAEAAPPPPTSAATPAGFGITNRLPLAPGGEVRISFSINNESMTAPKKVDLRVEGFAGDAGGAPLDAALFSVKPARRVIEPMDFEKFVLQGTVPQATPPDTYRGWVVASAESELRIPVWLTVMPL